MQNWEMREAILKVYPKSESWKKKVAKMSDNQVLAIYMRFIREGIIK